MIAHDWKPAPGERCCGTCAQLREVAAEGDVPAGLVCELPSRSKSVERWWGTACPLWVEARP